MYTCKEKTKKTGYRVKNSFIFSFEIFYKIVVRLHKQIALNDSLITEIYHRPVLEDIILILHSIYKPIDFIYSERERERGDKEQQGIK